MKQVKYVCVRGLFESYYTFEFDGKDFKVITSGDCWRLVIDGHRSSYTRVHLKSMFEFVERKYSIKLVRGGK